MNDKNINVDGGPMNVHLVNRRYKFCMSSQLLFFIITGSARAGSEPARTDRCRPNVH